MNTLNEAFALPGININLTIGLTWVQPNAFIPLNTATRERLQLLALKP